MPAPRIQFLVNLRAETARPEFRGWVRPHGWLLPPAYASASTIDYARSEVAQGRSVLVDNGLFDDLARIADDLSEEAAAVVAALDRLRDELGGPGTRTEVPEALRAAARDVAALAEAQTAPLRDRHAARAAELAGHRTTGIVGAEDPTPGVCLRLGIAPDGTGLLAAEWRKIADRLADFAAEDQALLPPGVDYLPVASPLDEASARYWADVYARAGLNKVAIGFGAHMAQRGWASRIVLGHRVQDLPANWPSAYVNSVVVLHAFMESYRDRAGKPPAHLHLLGLGAPIMIGLASELCKDVPVVTLDATSPIRDASFGTLYSNHPALLKLDPTKVAQKVLTDQRRTGWTCRCGACAWFHGQFPQDADEARTAWQQVGSPADITVHLVEGDPLGDALPLLAVSRPGRPRASAARRARLAHNHWALCRLCDDLGRQLVAGRLSTHLDLVIQQYCATASPPYAASVEWAAEYARS